MGRAAVRALRAMQPDGVHAHGEFNPDNWWAPRLWDCPIILSPQGAFHPTVRARRPWEKLYISVGLLRRCGYQVVLPDGRAAEDDVLDLLFADGRYSVPVLARRVRRSEP